MRRLKLRKELNDKLVETKKKPNGSYYKGRMTIEEQKEIETRGFEIKAMSIYMDGSSEDWIRYRGRTYAIHAARNWEKLEKDGANYGGKSSRRS